MSKAYPLDRWEFKPLVVGRLTYSDRAKFDRAVAIAKAEPRLSHGIEFVYEPKAEERNAA